MGSFRQNLVVRLTEVRSARYVPQSLGLNTIAIQSRNQQPLPTPPSLSPNGWPQDYNSALIRTNIPKLPLRGSTFFFSFSFSSSLIKGGVSYLGSSGWLPSRDPFLRALQQLLSATGGGELRPYAAAERHLRQLRYER